MPRKKKISTFDKTMTPEEAEQEKRKGTPLGKSLKKADEEYKKRKSG